MAIPLITKVKIGAMYYLTLTYKNQKIAERKTLITQMPKNWKSIVLSRIEENENNLGDLSGT